MLNAYPNHPPSAFPLPPSRAALTLAEVLIAMGLMTLGLLGVAAVFPVGGFYMQSGDIADRGGAIAQAALEDAIIQGHLDPKNWIVHDFNPHLPPPGPGDQSPRQACAFMKLMSGEAPLPNPSLRANKRVGLRQALADSAMPASVLGQSRVPSAARASLYGGAFVIDPIGLSGALADTATNVNNSTVLNPATSGAYRHFPAFGGVAPANGLWGNWGVNGAFWPVRKVTVHDALSDMNSSNDAGQFQRPLSPSSTLFTSADDLALSLPESGDEPAQGLWDTAAVGSSGLVGAKRTSRGDYSWVISVAPDATNRPDRMAADIGAYPVEVSAVVFHKRVVGRGPQAALAAQRLVNAAVVTSGQGGGQLLLSRRPIGANGVPASVFSDEPATSPFEGLRVGQFLMLTGPHPLSSATRPMLVLRWYRVLSIEKEGRTNLNGSTVQLGVDTSVNPATERVLVSLRGPDLPWQPAANLTATHLSNDLRVGILPGVVAVHTKTMRLESATEWSIR